MARFIMPCPDLIPGQTLFIAHMRPFPDATEVAACVLAVAVEVVLVHGIEMLGWEWGEV